MVLTGVCLLCLALMSDFGTALIFFATFLVIAYLRSGDFAIMGGETMKRWGSREYRRHRRGMRPRG